MIDQLLGWFHNVFIAQFNLLTLLGFVAQFLFMMRFIVQIVASERARKSVIPFAFWSFSIGGGILLLIYSIAKQDPVFIAGQALGLGIYLRNVWFVLRERKTNTDAA